jgi:hypothetical protein
VRVRGQSEKHISVDWEARVQPQLPDAEITSTLYSECDASQPARHATFHGKLRRLNKELKPTPTF